MGSRGGRGRTPLGGPARTGMLRSWHRPPSPPCPPGV